MPHIRFIAGVAVPIVLAAMLLAACGQEQPPDAERPPLFTTKPRAAPSVILTDVDADRAVSLQQGQVIEVRLPADRASGYTWIPAQGMAPVMHPDGVPQYEPGEAARADAPGTEIWRFIAGEPGHAHAVFEYRRPLGGGEAPQQSITFHFDVQ